jgi:hypothetical protein
MGKVGRNWFRDNFSQKNTGKSTELFLRRKLLFFLRRPIAKRLCIGIAQHGVAMDPMI